MINISERLRPFSHQPGTRCLLPTTQYVIEAYPALIRILHMDGRVEKEIALDIQGPLKQFTLLQDLEKGCVTLFSEIYRFHILPSKEMVIKKNPGLSSATNCERLFLGMHKQQNWNEIKKRSDLREILPIWFRLGQMLRLPPRKEDNRGNFALLKAVQEVLYQHRPEHIAAHLINLFQASFGGMFVPRGLDEDHQGILPNPTQESLDSPFYLLTEGSALIRSLFILTAANEISLLPNLPPEFFSGRFMHLECPPLGHLDLEWSKKTIRRVHFHAQKDGDVLFHFPAGVKCFRLRLHKNDRGLTYTCGDSLEIKAGCHYLLDRFQK